MTEGTTREMASGREDIDSDVSYHRPASEPPSISVAVALAHHRGEPVTETSTRLYEHIDPDALDTLFGETPLEGSRPMGQIRFRVDDTTITVGPDAVHVRQDG